MTSDAPVSREEKPEPVRVARAGAQRLCTHPEVGHRSIHGPSDGSCCRHGSSSVYRGVGVLSRMIAEVLIGLARYLT